MSSGRVGKAIVLTCFFTASYGQRRKLGVGFCTVGYGWHRSQWVKSYILNLRSCETAQRPFEEFLSNSQNNIQTLHHTIGDIYSYK